MAPLGSLDLLRSDVARRLLGTVAPVRRGYTAPDGTPRLLPMWFLWHEDDRELVLATFEGSRFPRALAGSAS